MSKNKVRIADDITVVIDTEHRIHAGRTDNIDFSWPQQRFVYEDSVQAWIKDRVTRAAVRDIRILRRSHEKIELLSVNRFVYGDPGFNARVPRQPGELHL